MNRTTFTVNPGGRTRTWLTPSINPARMLTKMSMEMTWIHFLKKKGQFISQSVRLKKYIFLNVTGNDEFADWSKHCECISEPTLFQVYSNEVKRWDGRLFREKKYSKSHSQKGSVVWFKGEN